MSSPSFEADEMFDSGPSRVRRALIPAAGLGTRMRPLTLAVPKELVSVGNHPVIHYVIREAAEAGIEELGLVLRPGKEILLDYLQRAQEEGDLPSLDLQLIYQQQPRGLGDAILLAKHFTRDEAFALLLPDNLPLGPDYSLGPLLRLAEQSGREAVGVIHVDASQTGLYYNSGLIDWRPVTGTVVEITRLHGKQPGQLCPEPGNPVLRACARMVFQPGFHGYLERCRPAGVKDYDEVPALQQVIRDRGAQGLLLPPPVFDVGHPRGLLAANAFLWETHASGPTLRGGDSS